MGGAPERRRRRPAAPSSAQEKVVADLALNDQRADKLGEIGETSVAAYEAALPDDGGSAAAVAAAAGHRALRRRVLHVERRLELHRQPAVKVQRQVDGGWKDYADQSGEIPVTLEFPQGQDVPSYLAGRPASGTGPRTSRRSRRTSTRSRATRATPDGHLPLRGRRPAPRGRRARCPYHLESAQFGCGPGTASRSRTCGVDRDRAGQLHGRAAPHAHGQLGRRPTIQAEIGPIDYPDSYASPSRFIKNQRPRSATPRRPRTRPPSSSGSASRCSFRPWADTGDVEAAYVTIERPKNDSIARLAARPRSDGRWYVTYKLKPGERAYVEAGGITDQFGDINGARSNTLHGRGGA